MLRNPVDRAYSHYNHEKRLYPNLPKGQRKLLLHVAKYYTFEELINIEFHLISKCSMHLLSDWSRFMTCMEGKSKSTGIKYK